MICVSFLNGEDIGQFLYDFTSKRNSRKTWIERFVSCYTPYFDQFISIEWVQREQTKKRMNRSFTLQRQSMPFCKYLYREQEEGAQYRYFFTCAHVYIPQNCSPFVIYDPLWRMTQYLELGLELEQSFSIPLVQPSTQTLNISVVIMTFTNAPPPHIISNDSTMKCGKFHIPFEIFQVSRERTIFEGKFSRKSSRRLEKI